MSKFNYVKEAKALASIGVSIIPLNPDGSKMPKIKWKDYQSRIMNDKEIEKYCTNCGGLAAITGSVSALVCFDFDLDKQILSQDYWKSFMAQVPNNMKERMLVNTTRSGGYHVWMRVDFTDKSRKVTHRLLTIKELYDRYIEAINEGVDPDKISNSLLNKPKQCVIETRFEGSYGVISHESYKRVYGNSLNLFTKDEIDYLLTVGYSLDCDFRKRVVYTGDIEDYSSIRKYNEDTSAQEVSDMMIESGMYKFFEDNGVQIKLKRVGSGNPYSAVIFKDTGMVHDFGMSNLFCDDKSTHTPFEVFCAVNNIEEKEAIKKIKK